MIAPSLAFLLLLFFVPLIQTIALAFQTDAGPSLGKFDQMLGDLDFTAAIRNTFELVVVVVPLQLARLRRLDLDFTNFRGSADRKRRA